MKADEGLEKYAYLVEAYIAMSGKHVQFNPISKAMLLNA